MLKLLIKNFKILKGENLMKKNANKSTFLTAILAVICAFSMVMVGCSSNIANELRSKTSSKSELSASTNAGGANNSNQSASAEDEEPNLTILAPTGEVYPYTDNAKRFLEAGEGADVADYYVSGQRNPQVPVQVKWTYDAEGAQNFIVEYATKADFSDAKSVVLGATKRSADLYNLYKGVTYHLRITAVDGKGQTLKQEQSTFKTTNLGPRVMNVDGVCNVRDLGGYETSFGKSLIQGIAYRGGMLHFNATGNTGDLTDAGRKTLSEELGITSELDFRSESESWVVGESSIPGATLTYITAGGFEDIFSGGATAYRKIFQYLADENNYPLYYHCTAGADRTGTVSYILHAFLGVSELECHQDFAFTSFSVYGMRGSHSGKGENAARYWAMVNLLKAYDGDTLQEKAQNYLLSIGLTEAELENIKKIFFGEIEIPNAKTYNPNDELARRDAQSPFENSTGEDVTADYATYTVTSIGATASSTASVLNIYSLGGDKLPKDKGDWSAVYTFVEGSGSGLTVNGQPVTSGRIKQPGDLYLPLDNEVSVGDIFVIDGAYVNADKKLKFVFENCAIKWNGTAWETVVVKDFSDYTTYEIGALKFNKATNTNDNPTIENGYAYFLRADGETIPIYSKENNFNWDTKFSWEEGAITYNGEALNNAAVKFPTEMFVSIRRSPQVGDVLTIGGNFYYDEVKIRYVIKESSFEWDGTAWVEKGEGSTEPDEPTDYTTYEIGMLAFNKVTDSNGSPAIPNAYLYLKRADGVKMPIFSKENNLNWDTKFSFDSGCITINDVAVSATVKFPNDMFIAFTSAPQVGDVLKISGRFYSDAIKVQYFIEESAFEWNGTAWIPIIEYTEYNIGKLSFYTVTNTNDSRPIENGYIYFRQADGKQLPIYTTENNANWETLFSFDESCITINGVGVYASVKFPGEMFVAFKKAPEIGDVLKVGGEFYSETLVVKYYIEESVFVWDGKVWVASLDYTDYTTGALVSENQTSKSSISLKKANGNGFEFTNSNYAFTFFGYSGAGIQLNGESLAVNTIKTNANEMLINLGVNAKEGDVLRVGGIFYNLSQATRYMVDESAFIYTNGAWAAYEISYTEIGVGKINVLQEISSEKGVYFVSNNANLVLPVNNWDDRFTFVFGVGAKLNGTLIESAKIVSIDSAVYISLCGLNVTAGNVLSFGGKLVCDAQNVLYYVGEVTLVWTGEAWVSEASVNLQQWKNYAKEELNSYVNVEDYEVSVQEEIGLILQAAAASIDNCSSMTELSKVVADTKAALENATEKEVTEPDEPESSDEPESEEVVESEEVLDSEMDSEETESEVESAEESQAPVESEKQSEPTKESTSKEPTIAKKRGCSAAIGVTPFAIILVALSAMVIRKKKD